MTADHDYRENRMKSAILACLLAAAVAVPSASAQGKSAADDRKKQEIAGHRAMAAAHEKAAQCLEAGKAEKECHVQLEKDCRGIGIGKHCGMKHRH